MRTAKDLIAMPEAVEIIATVRHTAFADNNGSKGSHWQVLRSATAEVATVVISATRWTRLLRRR